VNRALKVGANVYHVYIACVLAKLRELGMLKFGIIKEAAEATGRSVAQYVAAQGLSFGSVEEALEVLNAAFGFSDEIRLRAREDGVIEVMFHKNTCKICPRNVGGLELPGPACPNVGFVKGYLEGLGLVKLKEKFDVLNGEPPVKQQDGYCVISYQVLERGAGLEKAPIQILTPSAKAAPVKPTLS